ncbi:hypothetical protein BGW38_010371 [Lunasporangiospora selenospora]|uniref:Uncharacterized protein n=1 Tax=Lunasporangiospora selenospora TaxID=979761 RepID=A0A9P6FYI9_9FUNG|nr:hypothetical protein BGW38_010371 [Lunasporangiospora selenospora]
MTALQVVRIVGKIEESNDSGSESDQSDQGSNSGSEDNNSRYRIDPDVEDVDEDSDVENVVDEEPEVEDIIDQEPDVEDAVGEDPEVEDVVGEDPDVEDVVSEDPDVVVDEEPEENVNSDSEDLVRRKRRAPEADKTDKKKAKAQKHGRSLKDSHGSPSSIDLEGTRYNPGRMITRKQTKELSRLMSL